jgi:hypothetical protein
VGEPSDAAPAFWSSINRAASGGRAGGVHTEGKREASLGIREENVNEKTSNTRTPFGDPIPYAFPEVFAAAYSGESEILPRS